MADDQNEDSQLRSVALQNAKSILAARERAERELAEAKQALELKTEQLEASLAMVQATLESSSDAILVTDADGTVTNCNRKYAEMWGIPAEIMTSGQHQRLQEVCSRHLHDPWEYLARTAEIYRTAPAESFDLLKLLDGRVIERVSTIQYVGDRNAGRVWNFRDITKRTTAEEEIWRQREWFRVTLRSIGDAVITTDVQGRITFLNPTAEALTGWSSEEAVGLPLKTVFHIVNEHTRAPAVHPIDTVLREGIGVLLANHTALISRDGTETSIEDSAAPIRDLRGTLLGAVMVFHDVTDRRHAEESLKQSYGVMKEAKETLDLYAEELEKQVVQRTTHLNESIKSLESLCYTIAHDLRAPLRAVQGFTHIILEKYAPAFDDEGRALADRIMTAATRMDALIRDLLEYAKLSHADVPCHDLDLNREVRKVVEGLQEEIVARQARVSIASLPRIWGNPTIVDQVISNLLSNALKFVEDGTAPVVEVWALAGDRGPRIFIRDNGIGIAVEHHARIFEMFERLHEKKYSGTGVGLAIVKKGMERMGGQVSLEAHPANGSCFYLDFQAPNQS